MVDEGLIQSTPAPLPTLTVESHLQTPAPSETQLPATLTDQLTPTETLNLVLENPEPNSLPEPLPYGQIQIIRPGRLSRVISPFQVHVYLAPQLNEREEDLHYQISLYGEDGSLIVQQTFQAEAIPGRKTHLVEEIEFTISGAAESSRLEISLLDGFGRLSALVSTDLILLSEGELEIKPILDLYETLIIQQPIASTLIQGDSIIIQGVTRFAPGGEIVVELVNREGELVGSGVLPVSEEDLGYGYRSFEGEIPFQVDYTSWIRVQLSARDGKFSGIQHLSSVEVLVSP
jgi:hypothetical protein